MTSGMYQALWLPLKFINTNSRHCCRCLCKRYLSNNVRRPTAKHKMMSPGSEKVPVDVEKIRNIGIMAHIDAGKTTTTERMLFYSGFTRHLGDVDDGDTVMDYMDQERDRGITITSAAITFHWKKYKINLIDTPGHVDFTLEVERALRVLDGAVAVIDASAGVEAQTITVWRQADNYNIPRLVFINKMDKHGADFKASIASLRDTLQVNPLLLQLPIGQEGSFKGFVDLVRMEKVLWTSQAGQEGRIFVREPITCDDDLYEESCQERTKLIESLADVDDTLADLVLADADFLEIQPSVLRKAIRTATLKKNFTPVLCGSALKNKGVQPLLDAVLFYLPSPLDIHHDFVQYYTDKLCALAFKIIHDKQRGVITFVRIYAGHIKSGSVVFNVNRSCQEKIAKLVEVFADEYQDVSEASVGNIVAISGLKETISGDTLTVNAKAVADARKAYAADKRITSDGDDDSDGSDRVGDMDPVLAGLHVPEPVFLCSVEPASMSQQKALDHALTCLVREDPSLRVSTNTDTGQTILSGMGELHLEVIHHRIRNEYKVDADLSEVYIAYRETVTGFSQETDTLDRQLGDTRHQVTVSLSVSPDEGDQSKKDRKFMHSVRPHDESTLIESRMPVPHRKAVKNGVLSAFSRGPLLRFPVVDVSVCLHDLRIRRGTSMAMVTSAVAQTILKALHNAHPILLEPMMAMQVQTNDSYVGSVLKDLVRRRSQIIEVKAKGDLRTVITMTPLSELMGYSTELRTFTSGTASFSMELEHYLPMTEQHQRQTVAKASGIL